MLYPQIINSDGFPIAQFSANGKSFSAGGRQISSLDILLHALEENGSTILSKPAFSNNLRDFRKEIETIFATNGIKDGWDSIYEFRNASLHGAKGWQLRSGLLTNLICLILWNLLDEQILESELGRLSKMHMRHSWDSYYPPEL